MDAESVLDLSDEYAAHRHRYVDFAGRLRDLVSEILRVASISGAVIEARAKTVESLEQKLSAQAGYRLLEDVADLCGVRIILVHLGDIVQVAELLRSELDVVEEVLHGASRTDAFGYQSLHLVMRLKEPRSTLPEWSGCADLVAEIQIRTVLQHAWAVISHQFDYKSERAVPEQVRRRLFRVAALVETGDEILDGFRRHVGELREEYAALAGTEGWSQLPVNRDSLRACWSRFDWGQIAEMAASAGLAVDLDPVPADPTTGSAELADIASRCGIDTLGELAEFCSDSLPDMTEVLGRFSNLADRFGHAPLGIPSDVIVFGLALRNPEVAPSLRALGYKQAIVEAVVSASE